jgi:hypothetical protein
VLVCDLVAVPEAADLAVVDALARLDLAASRVGGRIAVQGMTADLLELLRLVGLDELARS